MARRGYWFTSPKPPEPEALEICPSWNSMIEQMFFFIIIKLLMIIMSIIVDDDDDDDDDGTIVSNIEHSSNTFQQPLKT